MGNNKFMTEERFEYDNINEAKAGDIVEQRYDWSRFNQPQGKLSIVRGRDDSDVLIDDSRGSAQNYSAAYLKKVMTKPLECAVEGDIIVLTLDRIDGYYASSKQGDTMIFDHFDLDGYPVGFKVNKEGNMTSAKTSWKPSDVVVLKPKKQSVVGEYDQKCVNAAAIKEKEKWKKPPNLCEEISVGMDISLYNADACAVSNLNANGIVASTFALSDDVEQKIDEVRKEVSEKIAEQRDAMVDAMVYGMGFLDKFGKRLKPQDLIQDKSKMSAAHIEMMKKIKEYGDNISLHFGRRGGKSLLQQEMMKYIKEKQAEKEKTMPPIELKINGQTICIDELCDVKPEKVKTDLQRAPKWITLWYNNEGTCVMQEMGMSPKKAKKELTSNPELLGYTFRSYMITESGTTDIPLKSIEV